MKDTEYAEKFKNTSMAIYENGLYSWMSNCIADSKYVLEIGTGVGYSTLSMVENKHKVMGIDRNQLCLNQSIDLLESHGYRAKIINTLNIDNLSHEINNFFKGSILDVLLINTDLLIDNSLLEILTLNAIKFNCITAWQLGGFFTDSNGIKKYLQYIFSAEMRQICPDIFKKYHALLATNIDDRDVDWQTNFQTVIVDAGKIALENSIYKIAKLCLYDDGCISFINRISHLTEIDEILELTKSIDIDKVFNFTYLGYKKHEHASSNGINILSQTENQSYYFIASKFTK